jgi:hypothetical protein
MPIDRFSKDRFEACLPVHKTSGESLWKRVTGMTSPDSELLYFIPVSENVRILIWSSINPWTEMADDVGENSIRCYLANRFNEPLSNKSQTYITRVKGWEVRLKDMLRDLWKMGMSIAQPCSCGEQKKIFWCKKPGPNKGRRFITCEGCRKFDWFDKEKAA